MTFAGGDDLVVVVAHPDDEVLWLGGFLFEARCILVALPGHAVNPTLAESRACALAQYPLAGLEQLPLQCAGVYRRSDYRRRRLAVHGVTLAPDCPPDRVHHYQTNYRAIMAGLEPHLRSGPTVFTHNPWGEYGHEEHVQVCHAVLELAHRHGCSVWAWDGFSRREQLGMGVRLRADYFCERELARLPSVERDVDLERFGELRNLYAQHGVWTWFEHYVPPTPSRYLQLARNGQVLIRARGPRRGREVRIAGRAIADRLARHLPGPLADRDRYLVLPPA
jgi:LmbE family N-acetylglucosaminyl deacetylase